MDKILKEFESVAIHRRNEYFLDADNARLFVARCKEASVKLIGIESFLIDGPTIEPMDDIDYDSSTYQEFEPHWYYEKYHIQKDRDSGHWQESIQYVKDRKDTGWVFEFSYEGEE
jgi:hypothetical protein